METRKWATIQPRLLRYRSHYKIYLVFMVILTGIIVSYWGLRLNAHSWQEIWRTQGVEVVVCGVLLQIFGLTYLLWLRSKLGHTVQVHEDHIAIIRGNDNPVINFSDVESVSFVYWSIFYFKMKNGHKHYFNSSLERVDYIWEGLRDSRPDLLSAEEYERFRLKLVQYDHHQKRKEWFFKHRMIDVFNWVSLPGIFLGCAYLVQSKEILIHQPGLYFFRLFMYALLVLLTIGLVFSVIMKKLVFDKKIQRQMETSPNEKQRDLEYENVIIQKTKIFQVVMTCFVFAFIIKNDLNLYSVTKIKGDLSFSSLKKGRTVVIDNRFNCVGCKFPLQDGDYIMFGRGLIGQVLAKEGDMVGVISQTTEGRMIASDDVQEVPQGHVAIRLGNSKNITFVKISDLIGKIQK